MRVNSMKQVTDAFGLITRVLFQLDGFVTPTTSVWTRWTNSMWKIIRKICVQNGWMLVILQMNHWNGCWKPHMIYETKRWLICWKYSKTCFSKGYKIQMKCPLERIGNRSLWSNPRIGAERRENLHFWPRSKLQNHCQSSWIMTQGWWERSLNTFISAYQSHLNWGLRAKSLRLQVMKN
jgi:hypothetical protein